MKTLLAALLVTILLTVSGAAAFAGAEGNDPHGGGSTGIGGHSNSGNDGGSVSHAHHAH